VCISVYILCVCKDEGSEDRWLYSSDLHTSTNAPHVQLVGPCRRVIVCPSCGDHQHPASHNPPISTCGSAAGLSKSHYTPAEKSTPAKSAQDSTDQQKLLVQEKNLSTAEDSPASDAAASSVTCDLDYYVVEYVMKSQLQRVKKIEQEFGVTIQSVNRVCEEIVTVAFQRYNPTIQEENEEKARRAFIDLYDVVYRQIVQRTLQATIKPPLTANDILTSISSVYKEEIFVSVNSDGLFTLVGPFEPVTTVETFITKRYATQNIGHVRAYDHEDDKMEEFQRETDGDGDAGGEPKGPVSVVKVGGRLTVKVYSADITHSSVDVIVNAANGHLQNHAGVAGAIEKAGGDELRQDCEDVVKQTGPLKV